MKYKRYTYPVLFVLAALFAFAAPGSAALSQEPLAPPPGPEAASERVFVSPSVLRALQFDAKSPSVRVIVSFTTVKGRSGVGITTADVRAARRSVLDVLPDGSYDVVETYSRIPAVSLRINGQALTALRNNPTVYAINADTVIRRTMTEANALTGADTLHALGYSGAGVRAGIIDSGIDSDHPSLSDDLFHQQCFRTEGDCPTPSPGVGVAEDQDGHGTHVAGMITGAQGVSPDVEFASLKVFTTSDTSDTNILNALNYVIANNNAGAMLGIDFINMSLGGDNFSDQSSCDLNNAAYATAFATLNGMDVTIFVSTGNDADLNGVGAPGCVTGAVGVGSTDDADYGPYAFSNCSGVSAPDKVTCFSNTTPVQGAGELVDLLGPGCSIVSAAIGGTNDLEICGTSMATPYALGSAALLEEYLNTHSMNYTPAQIEDHLETTGVPITDYRLVASPTYPRVSAINAIGALLPLDPPADFAITVTTPTSVDMTWTAALGATEYRIYRSVGGGAFSQIGTSMTTGFTDSTPDCGVLSYYATSSDGTFQSLPSDTDSTTSHACPLAPTSLTASLLTADTIQLNWVDNATDETAYIVERQIDNSGFTVLTTLGAGATTHTDGPLVCGAHEYRVRAQRGTEFSAYSNIAGRAICGPANDLFADAELVVNPALPTTPVYTDTEPNVKYASTSAGDPEHSCSFGGSSTRFQNVWYTFTSDATTPARVTVSTGTSTAQNPGDPLGPDTVVSIYTYDGSSFTEVVCGDDISGSDLRSQVSLNLALGTTYYVLVAQWTELTTAATGSLVTSFTFSTPVITPANDLFANAEVAANPALPTTPVYTDTESNIKNATVSGGDPQHTCSFGGASTRFQNVWYSITTDATTASRVTVSTAASTAQNPGDPNGPDTVVSIYTHNGSAFTSVGCNDDISGVNLRSSLSMNLAVGTTYYVMVSQWTQLTAAATGDLVTSFTFSDPVLPPANDLFANAEVISSSPFTDTTTNAQLATTSVGDPLHTCFSPPRVGTHNIWYSYTPTLTGTIDLDTNTSSGSMTDTLLSVLTGTHGSFTSIACDDESGTGSQSLLDNVPVTAGTTYTIYISRFSNTPTSTAGTIVLHFSFTPNPAVTVNPTTADVTEGGATDTYDISLVAAPSSSVTITITGDADCSATPSLTFTTGNYSTPQPVTVTAVDDGLIEGSHSCTISHSASGGGYDAVVIASVIGTVTDNDSLTVNVTPTTADVTEGSTTDTYSVSLNSMPSGDVTITVSDDAQCDVDKPTLTFTSVNYGTAQTVTVTATDDGVIEGAHSCTISHSSTGGGYDGVVIASVTGTVTDNDSLTVTVTPTAVDVSEAGGTHNYSVWLNSQPSSDMTITVTGDADCGLLGVPLIFTTGNYGTAQTVTVNAFDDAEAEGTHGCTITHSAAGGGYDGVVIPDVTGTVTDNDTIGVTIAPTAVNVTEGSTTGTYNVKLNTQPTGDVTISVTGDTECSVDDTSLTFTSVNYATNQPIVVSAINDAIDEADGETCTITHSASGGGYNSVVIASVTGTITDNDTAGVTIAPTAVNATEGGATGTYNVSLNTQPTADVTITVTGDAQCSVDDNSLTFTSVNYATTQPIVVTAINDAVAEGSHGCTITHSASGGGYGSVVISNVTGTITDNDTAGVTIAPTTADVTEGGATDTYNVSLNSEPTGDVTITVTGDAQCSVDDNSLTFTSSNYATTQPIVVTAVDDAAIEGTHACTITHSASGGGYNGVVISSVTGTITDNDFADPTTELIDNGSFEDAARAQADRWTPLNSTGDKRSCKPGKAHDGSCAYKFSGGSSTLASIKQNVDLTGLTAVSGDTLDLSAFFKVSGGAKGKLMIIVDYASSPTLKFKVTANPTGGVYSEVSLATITLTGGLDKLVVKISQKTTVGTIYVDLVSLIHTEAGPRDAMPAPSAPGGMRGSN